ncbi:MAG TPA: DUF4097 family beta strand repeat-containing protein [Actinomycetota bacterium]|jgi:DUF4097 and DUF4098 domain-containing protein YvlB|nr:DUF4097 family beta strand repeat-containing protein [Actinomycetota bacterium]
MGNWRVEDELHTDLEGVRRVVVKIVAGDVTVTAGPTSHIDVRRESGSDVDVQLIDGTLNVLQPDSNMAPLERFIKWFTEGRRHTCTVELTAPADASIDIVTVSAPVVVSGFRNGTRVKTVSGDVTLSTLGDRVDVKTVSGEVQAKSINGDVALKSVSGDLSIVDGACPTVAAKTVSGEVLLDLDLDPTGTYDVKTVSGAVSVRTKSEPNLSVDAKTVSGRVISDVGENWEPSAGSRNFSDTIGDGGARLHVKTVSGDLRIVEGRAAA